MQPGTKDSDTVVCGHHLPREMGGGGGACVIINAGIKAPRDKLNGRVNARTPGRCVYKCKGKDARTLSAPLAERILPQVSPLRLLPTQSAHSISVWPRRERQSEGGTARHAEERHVQVSVTSTATHARTRAFYNVFLFRMYVELRQQAASTGTDE